MARWAFDTLGIKVTKDKKLIKKAYSALVKQYHPEEYPDEWEEIHRAYQEAMEYARLQEEDEESAEEILIEDDYNEMFEEAHEKWQEEKSEKALALAKRLDELMQTPAALACKEWQRFFAVEFLPGAEADELFMLFEALSANEIPPAAAEFIVTIMKNRKEYYQASMETQKAALANGIINCIFQKIPEVEVPVKPRKKRKSFKRILKELLVCAGVCAVLFIVLTLAFAGEGAKNTDVRKMAVQQLNEKYGEGLYSEEQLEVEEDVRHGSSGAQLTYYTVREKESYDLIAYMLGRERDVESLLCFDKLQSSDIRQALEKAVNEKTGRPEGKLCWDSTGGDGGYIDDGYFHEKYEGNINEFLKLETKTRGNMAGTDLAAEDIYEAKNGNADYYVPDRKIKEIAKRLEIEEVTEDKEFLDALKQCASDYEIELQGIVLPDMLFEKKIKQADWDEEGIRVRESIGFRAMNLPLPFSMMTGWYVCVPPDGEEYLRAGNGMYSVKTIDMAEGIFGTETKISNAKDMAEELDLPDLPDETEYPDMDKETDMTGCMEEIKTPNLPEIQKKMRQTAVSFCLKTGYEMQHDYCLTIDKETYHLPDSGYQVLLTTYDGGQEDTEELQLSPYSDPRASIEYDTVLDGEGYLFVRYPRVREGEKAAILTILY